MPISLAASSQTQIGSAPFSNFRQRLSQSILGTKQLKVDATDSGAPFFIQTRNRAGCSPSSVQEVGLRIPPLQGLAALFHCERSCWSGSVVPQRQGCDVHLGRMGRKWKSKYVVKIVLHLTSRVSAATPFNFPTCAILCIFAPGPEPSGSGTAGGNIAERNYPTFRARTVRNQASRKLQLIDSI
jgi:hypothetical protein